MKVSSHEHIEEIYQAKRQIIQLASSWLDAIRENKQDKAATFRRRSNQIKLEIKDKYDILI